MVQLRRKLCPSDPTRERLSRLIDCLLAYFVDVTFFDAEDAKMQNNQRAGQIRLTAEPQRVQRLQDSAARQEAS